jgi:hypothetical protein
MQPDFAAIEMEALEHVWIPSAHAEGSLCLPDVRMLLGGIGTLDDLDAPLPGADRLCGAQSW